MSLKRQEVRHARTKSQIHRTHGSDSYEHEPRNKAQRELGKLIVREALNESTCLKHEINTCLCDACHSERLDIQAEIDLECDTGDCKTPNCFGIPDDSHGYCRYCFQDMQDTAFEAYADRFSSE